MDHTPHLTLNTVGLFTPGRLGPYILPHRILMAPMTRNRAQRDGVPSPSAVIYYAQRASAAVIVTETTAVSEQAVGYPFMPGIHTADQVAGWIPVVDAVHRFGCRIFLQLFHAGRVSHPSLQPGEAFPVAPSPIAPNGQTPTYQGPTPFVPPRGLALEEIPNIVEQFRVAAHNALLAGFDGVEIHGANGYLLDQFLRDGSNQRTDAYGGSVANRIRLLLQVTEAVADVWGHRVGVRISPLNAFNTMFDSNPGKTFGTLVTELAGFHLAYLHVVEEDGAPESGPRFDMGGFRDLGMVRISSTEIRRPPRDEGDRGRTRGLRLLREVVPRESGPAAPFCSSCAAQHTGSRLVLRRRRSRIYRLSLSGRPSPCAAATRSRGRRARGASCVHLTLFSA